MMLLGAAMSATGVGAVAGGPLMVAGLTLAGASAVALRRSGTRQAQERQQESRPSRLNAQQSSPRPHSNGSSHETATPDQQVSNSPDQQVSKAVAEFLAIIGATVASAQQAQQTQQAEQQRHVNSTATLGAGPPDAKPSRNRSPEMSEVPHPPLEAIADSVRLTPGASSRSSHGQPPTNWLFERSEPTSDRVQVSPGSTPANASSRATGPVGDGPLELPILLPKDALEVLKQLTSRPSTPDSRNEPSPARDAEGPHRRPSTPSRSTPSLAGAEARRTRRRLQHGR